MVNAVSMIDEGLRTVIDDGTAICLSCGDIIQTQRPVAGFELEAYCLSCKELNVRDRGVWHLLSHKPEGGSQ